MLKRDLMRLGGSILLGGVTILAVACGGSSGPPAGATATSTPTVAVQATATALNTSALPATRSPAPTGVVPTPPPISPTPGSDPPPSVDLLALGKEVFEKKAGGVGCQSCHGIDGKGKIGPNIRGKTAENIRQALSTVDLMMEVVKNLDAQDIEAVAAYLKYLATQP